jgi:hypothetical protein
MPLVLSGSTGIVEGNIADSAITTGKIANSNVTATNLHTTAVTDKLGYTPANKAGDTFTGATYFSEAAIFGNASALANTWKDLEGFTFGEGASANNAVILRKAKRFDGSGASSITRNIFQYRMNYGWASYFLKVHIYEVGYLGTAYRSATLSQHGTGTNVVSGSYSPWWRYDINPGGMHSSLNFVGSGPTGGNVDVGWYDVTAQVSVAAYTSAYIIVEYGSVGSVTINGTFNSKNQLNFL